MRVLFFIFGICGHCTISRYGLLVAAIRSVSIWRRSSRQCVCVSVAYVSASVVVHTYLSTFCNILLTYHKKKARNTHTHTHCGGARKGSLKWVAGSGELTAYHHFLALRKSNQAYKKASRSSLPAQRQHASALKTKPNVFDGEHMAYEGGRGSE